MTEQLNFFSLDKLANGFSEVEKDPRLRVVEVRLHPDDVSMFLSSMNGEVPVQYDNAVVGQIWQAVILKDDSIPRTRVKLVSCEADGRRPIEVWV